MTQEEKLMRKISQGDREAAEQLVQLLYPELLRYCLQRGIIVITAMPPASLASAAGHGHFPAAK